MSEQIEYRVNDRSVEGYLALPPGEQGPGVLLLHAWWGLNDFFTNLADRLAGEGFTVLAPDLYGGRTAATIEEAEALSGTLDHREAIKDVTGAAEYLLAHPSVEGSALGVVGFSMGAAYATWLATLKPEVKAVVIFYGGFYGGDEGDYAHRTGAAFLGHLAETDPYESEEEIRQSESMLRDAGRDVEIHTYPGTGHWFFETDRPDAYHEEAAHLAWERTVAFLRGKLK
jgi:carboxymethylenebutenolidase